MNATDRLLYELFFKELPVYPNGQAHEAPCECEPFVPGRTKIDGRWRFVCFNCGSLIGKSQRVH